MIQTKLHINTKGTCIPGLYHVTTSINQVALTVEVSSMWTRAQWGPVCLCAAGTRPSESWYGKHFYALSMWLITQEFICCLAWVKENGQFSDSHLGWIFKSNIFSLDPCLFCGMLKTYCSFS